MNPNYSMSFDEKNEFMPGQQQSSVDPRFENFVKTCYTDPKFLESMMSIYRMSKPNGQQQFMQNSFGFPNNSGISQSQPNLMNQSTYSQHMKVDESRSQQYERAEEEAPSSKPVIEMKRKPANPLLKYQPKPKEDLKEQYREVKNKATVPSVSSQVVSYQDQPIKSKFIQHVNSRPDQYSKYSELQSLKENQSINIDQKQDYRQQFQPKSNKDTQRNQLYRQAEERPINGMKASENPYRQVQQRPIKGANPMENIYRQAEERPIKGITKDFKQMVKERFPEPFSNINDRGEEEYEEQDQANTSQISQNRVEPKNFLKRGSRQHLSSAATRSKQPKKQDTSLNKSGIQENYKEKGRDITPKNNRDDGRSVSQNRVLGKRNTDKSVGKQAVRKVEEDYSQDMEKTKPNIKAKPPAYVAPKQPERKNEPPKASPSAAKKKKKNVFDDNSDSSSSSSEEEVPFFKAVNHKNQQKVNNNSNLIEAVEGVFLTNEQLQQIVQRYGKKQVVVENSESQKMAALRKKYTELCQLVEEERQSLKVAMDKEREQFEVYKSQQMNKIKNERRVMERQVKSGGGSQNLQREKEEIETLKKQLQKERQDYKKKEKNSKMLLDKYKKENEELKQRLQSKSERIDYEKQTVGSKKSLNNPRIEDNFDEKPVGPSKNNSAAAKKKPLAEEDYEQITYKDIKKQKPKKGATELQVTKPRFQYEDEEDHVVKNKSVSLKNDKKPPVNPLKAKAIVNKFNNDSDDDEENYDDEHGSKQPPKDKVVQYSPAMKLANLTQIDLSIKMVSDKMIENLFRYENNIEYRMYKNALKLPTRTLVNSARNNKNKLITNIYSDGSKEMVYDNGTRKDSLPNGYSIVYFQNGDIKQTFSDKNVMYYFKQKEVDQITLTNGINIYRFENNQVEFHFDGGKYIEIRHPDGTIKVLGSEPLRQARH